MTTTRIRLLNIAVGFAMAYMTAGVWTLTAQDDCKALSKALLDAFGKFNSNNAHVYNTSKVGSQTITSELIYAAGAIYTNINGTWMKMGSIKDAEAQIQPLMHGATAKDTCRHVKDEPVNGEMAALYSSHSETPTGELDMRIWISKAKGLVLRQDLDSGKFGTAISSRYEYGNVKPPL